VICLRGRKHLRVGRMSCTSKVQFTYRITCISKVQFTYRIFIRLNILESGVLICTPDKPKHISHLQSGGQIILRNTGHSILRRSIRIPRVICLLVFLPPWKFLCFAQKETQKGYWLAGFLLVFSLCFGLERPASDRVLTWRCPSSFSNGV